MAFTFLDILPTIFSIGLTLLGFLFWQKIKTMDERSRQHDRQIELLEAQLDRIRTNYLNRFDDLKDHVTTVQLNIVERISILETRLSEKLLYDNK